MACRGCGAGLSRLHSKVAAPLGRSFLDTVPLQLPSPSPSLCASTSCSVSGSALTYATIPSGPSLQITARTRTPRRALHTTSSRQKFNLREMLLGRIAQTLATEKSSYYIYGAAERLYNACAAPADYTIDPKDRKAGKLQTTAEGEEIGVSKGGSWHTDLGLLPTFNTWAHITMLHMYLLVVRFRCFDAASQQAWQTYLVNHFFYHAEAKMDEVHELTSRLIRQKYLKDLFVQWRGLILAYDEGLVKGDAVLASAVWRNLFKAREDVDVRALAAVVAWMRAGLAELGGMTDDEVEVGGHAAFGELTEKFRTVDLPTASMKAVLEQAALNEASRA